MSGNPFRRAPGSRLPDESTSLDDPNAEALNPSKRITKKRVQIQSPPGSPELPRHSHPQFSTSDAHGPASLAPLSNPTELKNAGSSDLAAATGSDSERKYHQTDRDTGVPPPFDVFAPTVTPLASGMRAPYNPFARTLATREAEVGLQTTHNEEGSRNEVEQRRDIGRPAMDVDAFKNILLTGSASPSPPVNSGNTVLLRPSESNSGTDTSSISRHSIFDTTQHFHPESPRTSFDEYSPPFGGDGEGDGGAEHTSLMGIDRPEEIAPPAPPKPKLTKGPQTVSFADFDEAIPAHFHFNKPLTPPINSHLTSILRPPVSRSPSDLNKPLPAPPHDGSMLTSPFLAERETPQSQDVSPAVVTAQEHVEKKKAPRPPPPASRRQATVQERPSNLSAAQQTPSVPTDDRTFMEELTRNASSSAKATPPRPPPRKSQPVPQSTIPSIEVLDHESPLLEDTSTLSTKPMPPPPPRRQPSKSGNLSRTASNASRRSDVPTSSVDTPSVSEPGSNGSAPPPPPPRRGQGNSARSSTDGPPNSFLTRQLSGNEHHRRFSAQSFGSDRSVSMSSLKQVAEPGEEAVATVSPPAEEKSKDILADMSAFHAEIEALRAKAGD